MGKSSPAKKTASKKKTNGAAAHDHGGIAGQRLKSFIERVERLEGEKQAIATDITEVYAEAKANGFDTKIMREIVKLRRMDDDERNERAALLETYMRALGMLSDTPLGRAAVDKFVNAVAPHDGDSVSLTGPNGAGFSVKNKGGKKSVEQIAPAT